MCGKFTRSAAWDGVVDYAALVARRADEVVTSFTPMRQIPVVHVRTGHGRVETPMAWGFTDRTGQGRRTVRHIHARGETIDRLPTWAEAFRRRRGVIWADSFNEAEEVDVRDAMGAPTGRKRSRQWVFRPRDGRPIILGVIFDMFATDRGEEHEFVQVTTAANAMVGRITDRMPLVLDEADLPVWLGEAAAPLSDIIALLKPHAFDAPEWETFPDLSRRGPWRADAAADQADLFG